MDTQSPPFSISENKVINISVLNRFWNKVDASGECWLWTAQKIWGGYGRFFPTSDKKVLAHRFSYEVMVGKIPDRLQIDHLCRNRACVNPWHLELVTSKENTARGIGFAAINMAKTHCIRGHKFTAESIVVGKGRRQCLQCAKESYARRYRLKKKNAHGKEV